MISPVIATSLRTWRPVRAEMSAVAIVIPAEGPSFGMAPGGDVDVDVVPVEEVRLPDRNHSVRARA